MYGYDANYSVFWNWKAEREEMELASERETSEHPADGTGMGETWMPCQKYKAESTTGSTGRLKTGKSAGQRCGC